MLDLASGTGNITLEMLRQSPGRTVWALEANEDMLEYMRRKISQLDSQKNEQVQILKGDLLLSLRENDDESFDGAIMMNALYAMPDRARCLREIFRVLKPGGVLVYSSSTTETDVDRLFAAVRTNLSKKGRLNSSMRAIVDSAYERNIQMMDNIGKDTHDEVVNYAKHAGFCVEDADVERGAYEGAVTIVRAVKQAIDIGEVEEMVPSDQKIRVFISYAHEDKEWCKRIDDYLNPLERGEIEVWTDQALEYGDHWHNIISEKLEQSTVAILLVSTAFLNSDFITNKEMPVLLDAAKSKGLLIVPVILERCLVEFGIYQYPDPKSGPETLNLASLQSVGSPTEPIGRLNKAQQNDLLYELAKRILSLKQKA